MSINENHIESPKQESTNKEQINLPNSEIYNEKQEKSELKNPTLPLGTPNEEKENQNNELKSETPKMTNPEQPTVKHTPLSQDAKPYNYKKIKERKIAKLNEMNNINPNINNENNIQKFSSSNSINNKDIKRNNFVKKNEYSMQSPLFSYFNDSQKYLSEQYGQNKMKKSSNQINKMAILKDNNIKIQNSTPFEDIEENEQSDKNEKTIIMILIFSITLIIIPKIVLICRMEIIQYLIIFYFRI